jgi:hypothetical protein
MPSLQAVLLGILIALAPSVILCALLFFRAGVSTSDRDGSESESAETNCG